MQEQLGMNIIVVLTHTKNSLDQSRLTVFYVS